jgi:DNA-binding SARP family transcriptional activator
LATGSATACGALLEDSLDSLEVTAVSGWVQWLFERALCLLSTGQDELAVGVVRAGRTLAERQGASLYRSRFRLLDALAADDPAIGTLLQAATDMDLLSCAEAMVTHLHRIPADDQTLPRVIADAPDRWLPLIRTELSDPRRPAAMRCAQMLDEFGSMGDVRLLRSLAKSKVKGFKGTDIGRSLARRRSPTLKIADLGRMRFEVGPRRVDTSSIRRRSAGLLCYLLTRSNHLAARDQVLDALWPEVDPEPALNSLNQTLYFLRRDIDPDYDDDYSVQYVRFESDLVWLDHDLSQSESALFHRRAARALAALDSVDEGLAVLALYRGRFAPEFEYEEWASAWRELLHGQYLHLSESLVGELIQQNRMVDAADLAVQVLRVDADAEHMERELIWLYGTMGARSAAAEQYGHYAAIQRVEYGVEPPTLDEIIGGR